MYTLSARSPSSNERREGRRGVTGSHERGQSPHQAGEQRESCGQQSLIRVPAKAPSSLTPRLSSKSRVALSWSQHLSPRAQPRPLMPWLARSVGETPHHTLCRGSSQGPRSPPLPTAQTVLWVGPQPETNPAQPGWPVKTHSLGENIGKPTANSRQHSKSRYEMVSK